MNIERKNTLFLISLVVIIAAAVAGGGFLLARDQVSVSISEDLGRAQGFFVQAQTNRFEHLHTVASGLRAEPSLVAAVLTADTAAIHSVVEELYPRWGADFVAVYLDAAPGRVVAAGDNAQYASAHILSSEIFSELVRSLGHGDPSVSASAKIHDSLLQLVAVAVENPQGHRIAALLVGSRFGQRELDNIRQLASTDISVLHGKQVLASSIKAFHPLLQAPNYSPTAAGQGILATGNEHYNIRVIPPLNPQGDKDAPLKIIFAANYSSYWSPYKALAEKALYVTLTMLLLAGLLGVSVSRKFLARPIELIKLASRSAAEGDLTHRVPSKRNDELGELGESFNVMMEALDSSRSELERNRQRFRDFASSSSDWLWETDCSAHFTFVSSSVSETLDMPPQTWLGRTPAEVFPASNLGELTRLLRPADNEQCGFKDVEIWVHALNGESHCLRLNGVPIFNRGNLKGYRGTARDITKLKQDEKRLVTLTNQDHLTGLSNRRRFLEELYHEISRVERKGQLGVLLLIDLDHLKLINDTAGHAAGDQIIVKVAGLLRQASREEDFLARISGDEFAVAYPAMSEDQGLQKARQLLQRINSLKPRYGDRTLNISASIGVVTFPQQGKVPVELMAKADAAMSVAKSSGRNRVYRYDETDMMRERMDKQLVWKDRLLEALEQDALHLVFQPIVAVSSGEVHHFEVLVRMVGTNGVLVAPGKFIPAAEQFGLIQWVDRQIVSKAIRRLAALPEEMRDIGFSINLSGLSVGRQDTYELIEREVSDTGVDPARITFEITETAACEQLANAIDFIQKIRQLGCMVSLDDFGVGFSSFSYLKHLSADVLKIDGSFIRDIHNNHADQLFVKALVDVARGMGMRTIAEFVENKQVFELVRDLGVDYVQGYYLGQPQSSPENSDSKADDGLNASVA